MLYRIIFKILLLTYMALNGRAPTTVDTSKMYLGPHFTIFKQEFVDELVAKLKTYGAILLQNCGISYHWTSGYHRQLLYLKLSLRHICLQILLMYNFYH